jgi:hypothetical protein
MTLTTRPASTDISVATSPGLGAAVRVASADDDGRLLVVFGGSSEGLGAVQRGMGCSRCDVMYCCRAYGHDDQRKHIHVRVVVADTDTVVILVSRKSWGLHGPPSLGGH